MEMKKNEGNQHGERQDIQNSPLGLIYKIEMMKTKRDSKESPYFSLFLESVLPIATENTLSRSGH
jgi:hypothetical protein